MGRLPQVVTNARTLKVETEKRGNGLAATGVHFTIKGPDGTVHEGALADGRSTLPDCVRDASLAAGFPQQFCGNADDTFSSASARVISGRAE